MDNTKFDSIKTYFECNIDGYNFKFKSIYKFISYLIYNKIVDYPVVLGKEINIKDNYVYHFYIDYVPNGWYRILGINITDDECMNLCLERITNICCTIYSPINNIQNNIEDMNEELNNFILDCNLYSSVLTSMGVFLE